MTRSVKFILAFGLLASYSLTGAFEIEGTAPSVEFNASNSNPLFDQYRTEMQAKMNAEVKDAFDRTIDTAREQLKGFKEQKNAAEGFANANAYTTNSATFQGFQNYSLFAVGAGLMFGVQAPSLDFSYYETIGDDLKEKGDGYVGVGASAALNVGLNAKFLVPGLYLNLKYGAYKDAFGDFDMDFSIIGVGANYRLLDTRSLIGFVKWRGLSVGTGFYMQSNKLNMKIVPDAITTPAHFREAVLAGSNPVDSVNKEILLEQMGYGKNDSDANVILTPEFNMGLDVSTITIPVDVATAVSVLWGALNVTAGVGFDFNFGSNEIVLKGDSEAQITSDTTKVTFTPATVAINGSSDNGPSLTRMRLMTGLGLGLGPVKIDVPLIWYLKSGAAAGITVAVIW
jgi:hypothetical protein